MTSGFVCTHVNLRQPNLKFQITRTRTSFFVYSIQEREKIETRSPFVYVVQMKSSQTWTKQYW